MSANSYGGLGWFTTDAPKDGSATTFKAEAQRGAFFDQAQDARKKAAHRETVEPSW
jgi:hypothetical protein